MREGACCGGFGEFCGDGEVPDGEKEETSCVCVDISEMEGR